MKKQYFLFLLSIILSFSLYSQEQESYVWSNLPFGGGGFVTGVFVHPLDTSIVYVRTDVGGIFKYDGTLKTWHSLLDWLSSARVGFYGVESLALDPQNPEKLYAFVGTSYFNGGQSAILISSDYGETFSVVKTTFKAHGNGDGRSMGERLVVDPHNSNILFCGTREHGLYRSEDGGYTWSQVSTFPVETTSNGVGISFVVMDETTELNGVTQRIYAGVAQSGSPIYVSNDAGITWESVENQPSSYIPHRAIVNNSILYVTYANGVGPNISNAGGAVYTYSNGEGWVDISPNKTRSAYNYGGLSVVDDRILVTSISNWKKQPWGYGDEIFVSDDLGKTWTNLFASSLVKMTSYSTPWFSNHAMHWTGCATLDPKNPRRAFFISGNGLYITENLSTTSQVNLDFRSVGLENTVPLDIAVSPTGAIFSVMFDYDGATYTYSEDIEAYKSIYTNVHTPEVTSSSSVSASSTGSMVVRTGSNGVGLQYSINKGRTWRNITNTMGLSGNVSVSCDGTTIVHCPNGSTATYFSADTGRTWTKCAGLAVNGAYIVADAKNPQKFYVSNGAAIYVSKDGGATFTKGGSISSPSNYKMRSVPYKEGDIWAPCANAGLYRSINSASSFSKVSGVTACHAIGFGKAKPGCSFPAIYIWGTIDGTVGLYRSDDEAVHWVRINDDEHEFGGPGNGNYVMGDMAAYGSVFMGTVGRGVICGMPESGVYTEIAEVKTNAHVKISPNPVIDVVTIKSESQIKKITLYDMQGRCMLSVHGNEQASVIIPVQDIPVGVYLLSVITEIGVSSVQFVKQ